MTPTAGRTEDASRPVPGTLEFVTLLALMTSLVALAIDAMLPALGVIGAELEVAGENATQSVVTFLLVGMAVGQLVYGPISETTGRRAPILVGFSLFILGSALSFIARDFPMLLAGRLLQGIGVAGPRSVSIALIRDLHAGREMARILSMVMSVFILVPVVAPLLGELILQFSGWRAIFGAFILLSGITMAWFAFRMPETLHPARREPWSASRTVSNFRRVLSNRAAVGFAATAGTSSGAFVGYLSSSQQIFQDTYGTGSRFALWFAVLAGSIGLAALFNGRMVMRWGMLSLTRWALRSLTVLSTVFLAWAIAASGIPPFAGFMLYMFVAFFAIGILFGNINALAMETLGDRAGTGAAVVASGSLAISVVLGAIVGTAYDGTVRPLVAGFALLSGLSLLLIRWAEKGRPA